MIDTMAARPMAVESPGWEVDAPHPETGCREVFTLTASDLDVIGIGGDDRPHLVDTSKHRRLRPVRGLPDARSARIDTGGHRRPDRPA